MLLIYFVALLTIGFPIIQGGVIQNNEQNYDDDEDRTFTRKTGKYFHRRCSKVTTMGDLHEIMEELESIKVCFQKTLPSHTLEDDEGLEERCFENREVVKKCIKKFLDLVAPCLPEEEGYLPEFVMESYDGYSEHLCKHIHVLTIDGLLETKMAKCINKFIKHPEYSPHTLCYQSAKFANHSISEPITKADLCEDLDFVYECYERQFQEHCPDAPKAWEFESGLIDGIRSPCKDEDKDGDDKQEDDKGDADEEK